MNSFDEVPQAPNSLEAEQGVIGCLLLDNGEVDTAVSLGVESSWFFDGRTRMTWDAINALRAEQKPLDLITVSERLKAEGNLIGIGGMAYLAGLMNDVPSAANLPYYVDIMRDRHRRRRVLKAAYESIEATRGTEDANTVLDRLESDIMSIRTEHSPDNDHNSKSVIGRAIDSIEEAVSGNSRATKTGWTYLDKVTKGGLRPGQMIVIAGRPGTGKTAFAVSLMMQMAHIGVPSGIISLEMSAEELGMRMLAIESGVDPAAFGPDRRPTESEYRSLTIGAGRVAKLPIKVNDKPYATPSTIAAKARRWVRNDGIKLLVVDYLQLLQPTKKSNSRREDVDEISRSIKLLAKELQIPIVVLCQLNRDIERDSARKPRLSDLRESGAIEQDADMVGMLYNPSEQPQDGLLDNAPLDINLYVAKQRGGITNVDVKFRFSRWITRFDPWTPSIDRQAR